MTGASMYDTTEGIHAYTRMARGYDGRTHVERLTQLLKPGSSVLELGMGPGVDLDMLAKTYTVVGSDLSQAFLDRYRRLRPGIELERLDAVTINTTRRFDAIYSNKVLQHLTREELRLSLIRQSEILQPGGLILHGLWAGATSNDHGELHDTRYLPDSLERLVPPSLTITECVFYAEMAPEDSVRLILRPTAS
ncbi:trans-aconitate 2-methyltransferase [Salinibacterium sp. M195]|uniref:class I SAM-dependent methyltransferase n=1 Tax=Salinibacterium sp. M195 TaxID=2583374 RepID=UPI001C629998|nr:class I SAM-dependent methyltransferase [Salinibacterium sp. M195]